MRYIQPQILRIDNANLAIQSVGQQDNLKPSGSVADRFPGTIPTTQFAYEADE